MLEKENPFEQRVCHVDGKKIKDCLECWPCNIMNVPVNNDLETHIKGLYNTLGDMFRCNLLTVPGSRKRHTCGQNQKGGKAAHGEQRI